MGGDLELTKFGWYVIDWGLDGNDKPYMQTTTKKLWITTPSGNNIPSNKLNPNTPSIYLCVSSQIDGDQSAQLSKLLESAKDLSRKLSTCHMPHQYGQNYQQCSINPKLSYPLLASSLSDRQIESIQKIIHPSVIAAKGFNRNWQTPLRYGKHKYCELEMLDGFKSGTKIKKNTIHAKTIFKQKTLDTNTIHHRMVLTHDRG